MSGRRGSATIERLPSARGPNSIRPWNQPTTSPAAMPLRDRARRARRRRAARASSPAARERRRALLVAVLGPVVRVLHHEAARPAELAVPDVEGGADRRAGVAGRRLDVDLARTASRAGSGRSRRRSARRRRRGRGSASRVRSHERPDEVQVRLLEHRLERGGDVLVQLAELLVRARRAGPKSSSIRWREEAADRRRALVPGHVDALAVVHEVGAARARRAGRRAARAGASRRGAAPGRRRARGPSPCPRRRTSGSRATA